MKYPHFARVIAAVAAAALLPACGGGGDEEGENFVSVQQFNSGSAGFFLTGPGGALRLMSRGQGMNADVGKGKPGVQLNTPKPMFDPNSEEADPSTGLAPVAGWTDLGVSEEVSRICTGYLADGGTIVANFNSMEYHMEKGSRRAYLEATTPSVNNADSTNKALAHFFGAVVYGDLPSASGNTLALVWYDTTSQRVLLASADGCSFHAWFDFNSSRAVVQLWGQVYGVVPSDMDKPVSSGSLAGTVLNSSYYASKATYVGNVFGSKDSSFRRVNN